MKWLQRFIQRIKIRLVGGIVTPDKVALYKIEDAAALWKHLQENNGSRVQVIEYKPLIDHFNKKNV